MLGEGCGVQRGDRVVVLLGRGGQGNHRHRVLAGGPGGTFNTWGRGVGLCLLLWFSLSASFAYRISSTGDEGLGCVCCCGSLFRLVLRTVFHPRGTRGFLSLFCFFCCVFPPPLSLSAPLVKTATAPCAERMSAARLPTPTSREDPAQQCQSAARDQLRPHMILSAEEDI
jgi:hypothetical protein